MDNQHEIHGNNIGRTNTDHEQEYAHKNDEDVKDEEGDVDITRVNLEEEFKRIQELDLDDLVQRKKVESDAQKKKLPMMMINSIVEVENGKGFRRDIVFDRTSGKVHNVLTELLMEKSVKNEQDNRFESGGHEEDSPLRGKRVFLQACQQIEYFTFPVQLILQQLERENVRLGHFGLGDRGATALARAVQVMSHVKSLALNNNFITAEGAKPLLEALANNTHGPQVLDISSNRLGQHGCGVDLAPVLSRMLSFNPNLTKLSLSRNKLTACHVRMLADGMADNITLASLDLSFNNLGQRSGEYLAKVASIASGLRHLNLGWNQITDHGALQIIRGLMNNNSIRYVNLCWNGLSDIAAAELGRYVQGNTGLQVLDISNNRITHRGARNITNGLAENSTLEELDMSNNPISVEGFKEIIIKLWGVRNDGGGGRASDEEGPLSDQSGIRKIDLTNCTDGRLAESEEERKLVSSAITHAAEQGVTILFNTMRSSIKI